MIRFAGNCRGSSLATLGLSQGSQLTVLTRSARMYRDDNVEFSGRLGKAKKYLRPLDC